MNTKQFTTTTINKTITQEVRTTTTINNEVVKQEVETTTTTINKTKKREVQRTTIRNKTIKREVHSGLPAFSVMGSKEYQEAVLNWIRSQGYSMIRLEESPTCMVVEFPIKSQVAPFELAWV